MWSQHDKDLAVTMSQRADRTVSEAKWGWGWGGGGWTNDQSTAISMASIKREKYKDYF
jgi:hypothetical protein